MLLILIKHFPIIQSNLMVKNLMEMLFMQSLEEIQKHGDHLLNTQAYHQHLDQI